MPIETRKTAALPQVVVGLIGAGNFAKITLLPILKKSGARLKTIADLNGAAGAHAARKFGFEQASNDYQEMLKDKEINTVFITTRHDLHSKMVIEALEAGKHVAVEKPLSLDRKELAQVKDAYKKAGDRLLLVGFNRRFSPHVQKMKQLLTSRSEPLCMTMLVNAGAIPADVWIQDKTVGGGRIIGEGCHWIDMMSFLAGAKATDISATMIGQAGGVTTPDDKMSITMSFEDGSIGTLHYFANGSKSFSKEKLEVFCGGKVLSLDNFRKLKGYGWKNFSKMNLWNQDKGHSAEFTEFINAIAKGGRPLIPFEDIENVTLASFAAMESAVGAGKISVE
jgi:predicted dehydrogenase